MARVLLSSFLSIVVLCAWGEASALQLDSAYLATIRDGIDLTVNERFDEARAVFQGLVELDSTDHAAYLFLAGVWHAEMFDREDYGAKATFDSLIGRALSLADRDLKAEHNPAWAHLTKGNAYAYIAALETKVGSWWTAIRKGLSAKSEYLEALKADPTLYDAYLGLGSYHYWKSAKTEFINWLPLIPDKKEEGLEELQLAIDSSLFSSDLAANSLLWIYLDCGRTEEAYQLASRLHAKHPQSRLFTWGIAFAAYQSRRLDKALDAFEKILAVIEQQPGQNNFNTIECRFHRAKILQMLGRKGEAVAELQALLNYRVDDEVKKRQESRLSEARQMLPELQK